MPNKKSAKKELRKSIKRQKANHALEEKTKKLIKKNLKSIEQKEKKVVEDIKLTISALDKLVKKGVIKKNTASRKKSQLQKKVNKIK
jgi:small subunit ribosomal protein S20